MAATAAQVARLRRMVAEPTETTYKDDELATTIESYPLIDERGEEPYSWDTSTDPPTQEENEAWIPTYDLAAAAAEVWSEKAALAAADYDFSADGASFSRSQAFEQAERMMRFYRARRSPRTITARPEPEFPVSEPWVGNLQEPRDW